MIWSSWSGPRTSIWPGALSKTSCMKGGDQTCSRRSSHRGKPLPFCGSWEFPNSFDPYIWLHTNGNSDKDAGFPVTHLSRKLQICKASRSRWTAPGAVVQPRTLPEITPELTSTMQGLQYTGFRQGEIITDQHGREYVYARMICMSMYVYNPR